MKDPDRFELVKQLLHLYLTGRHSGESLWRIAMERGLTTPQRKRSGGRPIALSSIYYLLARPIYAGFFYHDGERYELNPSLDRMITEEEYWKIQTMLRHRGRPRPQKRETLYGQFMRCGVYGSGITSDHKFHLVCSSCRRKFSYINRSDCPACGIAIDKMDNPTYRHYVYYQSSKERKLPGVKAKAVEERVVSQFLEDYVAEHFTNTAQVSAWCIECIEDVRDKELQEKTVILRSRKEAHDKAIRQRTELTRMRARGLIDDNECRGPRPFPTPGS